MTRTWCGALGIIAIVPFASSGIGAQMPARVSAPLLSVRESDVTAGSESENTLLRINLLDTTSIPLGIRPFSPRERREMFKAAANFGLDSPKEHPRIVWTASQVNVWYSDLAAHPDRDGAVWQGRGITIAATAGGVFQSKYVDIAFRPLGFVTQNLAYTPASPSAVPAGDFRIVYTGGLDMPYRFGSRAYHRLDPGESWVRISTPVISAGFSTSTQQWGPGSAYALTMGSESGGYPRVFLEIGSQSVGVGHIKGQWSVGRLESSEFENLPPGKRSRVAPAFTFSFQPRGITGLEVGAARMFHLRWRANILRTAAMLPFAGLLKARDPTHENSLGDINQVASAFARIAPAGAGVEVYGEFYREDHSLDLRDLIGEPDHASAYSFGIRRVWRNGASGLRSIHADVLNSRISHLMRVRAQAPLYINGAIAEGHTNRGQPLGTYAMPGGGGMVLGFEDVGRLRSTLVEYEQQRTAQNAEGGNFSTRLTGIHVVRFAREDCAVRYCTQSIVEIQQGFGWERGTRLTVGASIRRVQ